LQELLAPPSVVFFDKDWIDIGTKGSLEEVLSEITGIDDFVNFERACVAQKMSWAAKRETTRVEDVAYCLLGLFNVNMPPLYGEGEKAFVRLQLEILRTSDDESIFAWNLDRFYPESTVLRGLPSSGLLAASPKHFMDSGRVRPLKRKDHGIDLFRGDNQPFSMTNKGLHISLPLIPEHGFDNTLFLAPLKCSWACEKEEVERYPTIQLLKPAKGVERYRRVMKRMRRGEAINGSLLLFSYDEIQSEFQSAKNFVRKYIYVNEERPRHLESSKAQKGWIFFICTSSLKDHGFVVSQYAPLSLFCHWENSGKDEIRLVIKFIHGIVARMLFVNVKTRESIVLAIIVENGCPPCLLVITPDSDQALEDITSSLYDLHLGPALHAKGASLKSLSSTADSGAACVVRSATSSDSERSVNGGKLLSGKRPPLDRISRRLRDGKSVSASLKHATADDGGRQFLVDIGIDSKDVLRWSAPAWVETLLLAMAIKNTKGEEENPGTPTADLTKKHRRRRRSVSVSSSDPAGFDRRHDNRRRIQRDNRSGGRERSGRDRMMYRPPGPVARREESQGYRQPESQEDRQGYERERSRHRRHYDSERRRRSQMRY
jgi:hypothetical protein